MKKSKDIGIGVGLSCSKAIANSLGGDVFVLKSKEGEGTTIRTYIPAIFEKQDKDSHFEFHQLA